MRRKGVFSGKNPREEDSHEENPHEENPWEGKAPRRSDEESPMEPPIRHYFRYYLKNLTARADADRGHKLPITSNNFNDVSWDCRPHSAHAGPQGGEGPVTGL